MALACAIAGALGCLPNPPAQAEVNIWSGVTGYWADSAGWSLGTPPANGDRVTLTNLPGAASTLTFDALSQPVNFGQLTIDHTVGGSITLLQMDNTLIAATGVVGNYGNGMFVQSGGTHSVGNLYLGFLTAGSSGTVSLGGTGSLAVSGVEVLGYNGSGTLNQTGGNHSVGNRVFLGVNDGASGMYTLTGGSAFLGEDVYLGCSGSNSSGTLNLSGDASLTIAGHEYVGYAGSGTITHTGGTHSVGGSLVFANNPGSTGLYNLANSASLAVTGSETIGNLGQATFTQTGGTHSIGGNLFFAHSGTASTGQYTLSGADSSLNVTASEILAYNGAATFNHSGGSHTAGSLLMGINPGSSGIYNLSDAGSLHVNDAETVGAQGGAGVFNQTGGIHTVGGVLTLAATPASTGLYNLSGGLLTASVVSPLLANVYLHYAFDLWVQQWRTKQARGDVIVVRYADDFIVGFQDRAVAEKFLTALRERFAKFGLELHPDKTRLIEFGQFAAKDRRKRGLGRPETFNFLGLTHACDTKRSNGRFTVLRQTMRTRLQAKLAEVKIELQRRMHDPVPEVGKWLGMVVTGHCRYYGVPMNGPALGLFRHRVGWLWQRALSRPQPTRRRHLGSHGPSGHPVSPTCTHPSSVSITKVWCHPLGKSRMR